MCVAPGGKSRSDVQVCRVWHRKHNQVAENKGGTLPVGSGVAEPVSKRQAHEVGEP
jgi:hypothetical protein